MKLILLGLKKILNINIAFLFSFCLVLSVLAQDTASEVINVRAGVNSILIDVAKKYPEIKFLESADPNKVLIRLDRSKYHSSFNFDEKSKNEALAVLDSVKDITVKSEDLDTTHQVILLELVLKPDKKIVPKIASTKNNILEITLNNVENVKLSAKDSEEKIKQDLDPYLKIAEKFNDAIEAQKRKDFDRAEALYKEVISVDNTFQLAKFNLAAVYLDKGLYEKSISVLNQLVFDIESTPGEEKDRKDNLVYVHNGLGIVYFLKEDFYNAEKQFNEVLKLQSDYFDALYNLGLINENKKNLKLARKYFQKVIQVKNEWPDAYYHLAQISLIEKNEKEAVANFKKVIELAPESTLAKLSKEELEKLN